MDSVTVVENILKWGGKPVLAHPHKIPERFRWRVINSLIEAGLAGIEAFTSSYAKPEESNIYARIAKENNLLILAGTDLHQNIDDIGSFLLPYERFEQLRNGDSPS
jgi:predicted metal-dependent phosphoesterase TrpH